VFWGELVTPGSRENSKPNYASICLAYCEEKGSTSQAWTQELRTGPQLVCWALWCFSHWCDFHSLITESGLLWFLVSVEAQILTRSWFKLLDNWHAGLASSSI